MLEFGSYWREIRDFYIEKEFIFATAAEVVYMLNCDDLLSNYNVYKPLQA